MGIEPQALSTLGKVSTTELTPASESLKNTDWAWWYTPVIPVLLEAAAGGLQAPAQPEQLSKSGRSCLKQIIKEGGLHCEAPGQSSVLKTKQNKNPINYITTIKNKRYL